MEDFKKKNYEDNWEKFDHYVYKSIWLLKTQESLLLKW